jgi:transposase
MAAPKDAKSEILRRQGLLHPRPHLVTEPLFRSHEFFDSHDLLQVKYEMLRCVQVEGRSVTAVAAAFGLSRQAFYQAQAAYHGKGLSGLLTQRPGPRRAHKLYAEVMDFVLAQQARDPTLRASALASLIQETFDRAVHPRSLERALARRRKRGR